MIFRQLVEPLSNTYTYLLGCEDTRQALLIDPVLPAWERDLGVVRELGLKLAYTVETHVHADHITSGRRLKRETGSRIVVAALEGLACTDVAIEDGKPLVMGAVTLEPRHTPGHTAAHMAYVAGDKVFTGDALLIDGCGRTDFQNGDARALYKSVHERLFTLPDDQLVYPGHDYQDRRVSTIAQERKRNPRLGGGRTLEEFLAIMRGLKLPYPKFIDYAVPGNAACGECPPQLPPQLQEYCEEMKASPQG
ncbi:Zn-dependent hydrolase [Acidiferrobacter sp. SPIII_3]|jgi:glyoxylase-like metal-dependent hydrolase (beta-lactamase superfamily II)|uniref:MBL fold metallo-hydrolase n=1 Tax=Acidiferrobacter sp. SPIII_3 TaxID=1281578 RepID=UPI000D733CA7|nr:MBL fold metallo-hydrolase [Acidiferrobacter sp. SPIII_3]AWP22410.1 Zn-dependent hydrolase [Acidiferrobacter sp. SPIII_3]